MTALDRWKALTPAERDYDRFQGQIPQGASWALETAAGIAAFAERWKDELSCSCHLSAPCSFCTDNPLP